MTLPMLYNAAHRDNDVTMLNCKLAHMQQCSTKVLASSRLREHVSAAVRQQAVTAESHH